jgi:hypothetical protein
MGAVDIIAVLTTEFMFIFKGPKPIDEPLLTAKAESLASKQGARTKNQFKQLAQSAARILFIRSPTI